MKAIRSWLDIETHERVKCIEHDDSMDEGRFWVVYAKGWIHRSYHTHAKSAGSFAEARSAVLEAVPCDCEECRR